jgi:nucleoside phosphorylase
VWFFGNNGIIKGKIVKEWKSFLFCGAFDGETDLLAQETGLNVYNVGIGLHDSLFNLQRHLLKLPDIKTVVFLGSAGAYPHSTLKKGDIVYSYKFLNKDIAEIKEFAKVPDVLTKHVLTNVDQRVATMVKKLGFTETITNSMNYVTLINFSSDELFEYLYDVGAENMEAFSIAYVCSRMNLNFTAFYYITNIVGEKGSEDWAKYWREGSTILQKKVLKYLA